MGGLHILADHDSAPTAFFEVADLQELCISHTVTTCAMKGSQRFTTALHFPGQQPPEFVTASTYDTVLSTRSTSIRLILIHAHEAYLKDDLHDS